MLGIVLIGEKSSSRCAFRLWRETEAGFPLYFLEIHRKKWMGNAWLKYRIKKGVRALARAGVTRAAVVDPDTLPLLEKTLTQYGMVLIQDYALRSRLMGKIAIYASQTLDIPREKLGIEVVCGGALQNTQAAALDAFSYARYAACWGRGAEELCIRAARELGASVMEDVIPMALCDGVARLDFTGNPEFLKFRLRAGTSYRLERFELELPERFDCLYRKAHGVCIAAALVESGMLRVSDIQIRRVEMDLTQV